MWSSSKNGEVSQPVLLRMNTKSYFQTVAEKILNVNQTLIQNSVAYVVQKHLKEFTDCDLQEKLTIRFGWDEQQIEVTGIDFNPKALTKELEDFPFEVVECYLGSAACSIPWKDLQGRPTKVHAKDVDFTVRPKAPINKAAQLLEAMSVSMMHSMDASTRFAEEAITKENAKEYSNPSDRTSAVEWMVERFERIKAMVHVTVENVTIRMEVVEGDKVVGLEIHIDKIEYFDDQEEKARMGESMSSDMFQPLSWLTKNVQMTGITFSLDDKPMPFSAVNMTDSTSTSPSELFMSAFEELREGESRAESRKDEEEMGASSRAVPVCIATVGGRSDVKAKLKGQENVEGPTSCFPQIDASVHLGAIHALLSPKQMEFLIKILSSFAVPPESGNSRHAGALNRRMGPEDYEKVGQVLEQHMMSDNFDDVTEPFAEDCCYLANGERMFFTLDTVPTIDDDSVMNVSASSLESANTLSSVPDSIISGKRKEDMAQKIRESAARAASEPSADRSLYQLTVATVSVCLLHEEPHDQGGSEWLSKMQALSAAYFQGHRTISTAGQVLSLTELRDKISTIVPRDHLGLLCKPVTISVSDRTVRSVQSLSVDMNIHQMELVECLFDSRQHGNNFDEEPVRVPQYCEILTFKNAQAVAALESMSTGMSLGSPNPAFHLSTVITSKTGPYGYTYKETKVGVELGHLVMEVDITIQDRLSTVLTALSKPKTAPPPFSQPLLTMDGQYGFDEAMEDVMQSNNNAVEFNLSCPHVTTRIRFPIPDLRPPNQHAPREWWGRNLHKESLLLEIDLLSVFSRNNPEEPSSSPSCVEIMCNKLEAYFQEDFNKTPILFGQVTQGTGDVGDNFNRPRIVIKSFPTTSNPLTDLQEELERDSLNGGSLEENDLFSAKPGSTPFSLYKEITHGTEGFEGEDQEGFDSTFERVSPGKKEEMQKFLDVATSNTSLLVEVSAPKLLVLTHNKQFLELLYNRINNDLLLWQPQSPSTPEAFASGVSLNVQPAYLRTSMASMMMQSYYEDSDSDESQFTPHQTSQETTIKSRQPSDLCLSINIGEGKVFANVAVKETGETRREGVHGEMALLAKDGSLFVSVGHEGNKDLRYVTVNANRAQLYHAGCVEDTKPPVTMEMLDTLTFESKGCLEHMDSRIYRSEPTVPIEPLTDVGTGDMSEDMVAVAIQIKVDNWNNNKFFHVAAGVRGGTLMHEKFAEGEGWIQQIMDLLDLTDYPIEGYNMPEVLTDLNLGLTGCAIDYRPKNFSLMPMRSLLTVQKFSLASNLNMKTDYTTMKFLLDEANLFLSNKDVTEISLNQDYLRVGHVALLEVGLRLGQAHEKGSKTLLWFGNSKTEFRFCPDSCAAFVQLLDHFLHDKDLATSEDVVTAQVEEKLIEADETQTCVVEQLKQVSLDERTDAQNQHVESTIADALLEQRSPPAPSSSDSHTRHREARRPLYFVPSSEEGAGLSVMEGVEEHFIHPDAAHLMQLSDPSSDNEESDSEVVTDEDEEFTIIDDPGMGIAPKSGEPVVRCFVERPVIKWNFLSTPSSNTSADELKTPPGWPVPEFKCVLRELNLDICIYGGYDFDTNKGEKDERLAQLEKLPLDTPEDDKNVKDKKLRKVEGPWKGGVKRLHDTMVKLTLNKFRLQYEKYHESEEKSRRLVMVVKKMEIEDHLTNSPYNKFLYWPNYDTSSEGANMVCLKLLWERPDERFNTEECSVRLSLQHIKTNVSQITLLFINSFIMNMMEDGSIEDLEDSERDPSPSPSSTPRRKKSVSAERAPIFRTEGGEKREEKPGVVDDNLMHFKESSRSAEDLRAQPERPRRIDVEPEDDPTFFKSFVMTRPTTVTIDYKGCGANMDLTNIKKVASGVIRLENVQLSLKQLECNRGYRGVARLVEAVLMEWGNDIKSSQIGAVVGGIGPFCIFRTLAGGIQDFFQLPVEQYRKDGRLWRGFQKGALSLKIATQSAVLDLLKKIIESILMCSELCYDFLSSSKTPRRIREVSKPPKDLREGVSGAVQVFKEGFAVTINDLVRDTTQQREQKGLPGAVGHLIKNLPATICVPVTVLSAGADQCVTGIRYEVKPELLKEAKEKYKELQ